MAAPLSIKDIYWMAGLFEGEGCFGCSHRVFIQLGMTDKDIVYRAAGLLKRRVTGPYLRKNSRPNRPMYYTAAYGETAVGWMMTMYSILGERRRERIVKALSDWRAQRNLRSKLGIPSTLNGKRNPEYVRQYNRSVRAAHVVARKAKENVNV